jgi:hypothetical protein
LSSSRRSTKPSPAEAIKITGYLSTVPAGRGAGRKRRPPPDPANEQAAALKEMVMAGTVAPLYAWEE